MYRTSLVAVFALSAACIVACGKSEAEKRADDAKKAAGELAKGAEGMAKGLEDLAKSVQGAAGAAADTAKAVDPVSFKELQTVFPELSGWTKGKPTGEQMSLPVRFSEAKVTYTKGESRIEATVTDSAFNQLMTMGFSMMATTGYQKETDNGYEKATTGEYPGWEKRDNSDKSGEVGAIVNKRFILELEGSGIDDNKPLYELLRATDMKKLAALK